MTSVLKDNGGNGPPLLLLPTGEQQIVVSILKKFLFSIMILFFNIKVACRIRPMTEEEILQGATIIAHKVAEDNVCIYLFIFKRINFISRWLFYLIQKKIMMIFYVQIDLVNVNICSMLYPMLVLNKTMSIHQQLKFF